jgi:threonine dehydrogenase-like Zn-dependent dehydrogenase
MRAIVAVAPRTVSLIDLPIPAIGPYEALAKVEACGICNGTDIKLIDGEFLPGPFPSAIGHESVGIVVKTGEKVRSFRLGDRVLRPLLYDSHVPDGRSTWGGMSEYGIVIDGAAFRQDGADVQVHWAAPKQQVVPASISPAQAAAMITLKETLQVLKEFGVGSGKPVAILGTGPVAQAYCFFSKMLGASPVAVFGRRAVYANRFMALGADTYVTGDDYPVLVRNQIARGGFGQVIEAVGSPEGLKRCLDLAGPTGQVRVYGIAPASHSWDEVDLKDFRVQRIGAKEDQVHEEMLDLVARGTVVLSDWVSRVIPVQDYESGFELVHSKQASKVVLTF